MRKTCKRCGKETDMPFHTCHKPMNTVNLLTPEQIKDVAMILNRKDSSDTRKTSDLKLYLEKYRTELEAKGMVPDYLAYVLIAKHMRVI